MPFDKGIISDMVHNMFLPLLQFIHSQYCSTLLVSIFCFFLMIFNEGAYLA